MMDKNKKVKKWIWEVFITSRVKIEDEKKDFEERPKQVVGT